MPTPPTITTDTYLPAARVGLPYSVTLTATGSPAPTWSATGLPAGLAISSAGAITGTPTTAGSTEVTFTATNGTLPDSTLTATIVVASASLIVPADLEAYLQQDLTDYSVEAQAAVDQAAAVVEDHCKRRFQQVVGDTLTLRWRPSIVLPGPPVTEITSVTVDGVASDYDLDDSGRLWLRSSGDQIGIVYTHGYATIPDTVRLVALRLAARIFKNPVGRVSYSVDNASMQMAPDVSPRVLTSDEMAILRRYRLHSAR